MFKYSRPTPQRKDWLESSVADSYDSDSDESGYTSSTDTYFAIEGHHIAPIFPFTLASSFKRGKGPDRDHIMFHYADNIIRLAWNNFEEVIQFINSRISIRNRKYMRHVALDLSRCSEIQSKDFRLGIADLAKSFPSLLYLHLNFGISSQFRNPLRDKDLLWIGLHVTTQMPNIKHLSISFRENTLITPDTVHRFCIQIGKRLKRLECLTLDFSKCQNITDESLRSLTHFTTNYLTHLKNFKVIASGISDIGMKEMHLNKNRYLKKVESLDLLLHPQINPHNNLNQRKFGPDLRQFSLYLTPLQTFSEKGLDLLSSNCLRHLQNLRTLNLHLGSINLNLEAAQTFVKALNLSIKTLQQVKIHFGMCQQITSEFLELFECPQNNQLKKLEIQFTGTQEEEKEEFISVKPFSTFISKSLQNLKDLTYLDLHFDRVSIKDEQVKHLASCLAQNLSKLELLHVNFFMCPKITGESLAAFREALCGQNNLSNVKTLVLAFSSCPQITKEDFRALKNAMKKTSFNQESTKIYFVDYRYDLSAASSSDRHYRGEYSECTDPEVYDPTPVPENFGQEDIEYADSDEKEDCLEEQKRMREFLRRVNGCKKEKRWKKYQRIRSGRYWMNDTDDEDDNDNGSDSEEEEYKKWVEKRFFNKKEDHKSEEEEENSSLEKSLAKAVI